MNILTRIKQELKATFGPQDPMRFAVHSVPPPNWFGELERKQDRTSGGNKGEGVGEFLKKTK